MSQHTGSLQYTLHFAAAGSGVQIVEHTRLLIFKEPGGQIRIDHTPYEILPGCLFVIPRGHFYCLSESFAHREAAHIDVTEPENGDSQTMHIYRVLLYRVKYTPGKLFVFEEGATPVYESLLACREDATGQQLGALLYQWSRQYSGYDFSKPPAANQIARVQHFLEGLPATLDKGCMADNITDLASHMHINRSTLCRDCKDILKVAPSRVILYHKVSAVVYMLLNDTELTNEAIAAAAGFGDVSRMYGQIQQTIGYTPRNIRKTLWL